MAVSIRPDTTPITDPKVGAQPTQPQKQIGDVVPGQDVPLPGDSQPVRNVRLQTKDGVDANVQPKPTADAALGEPELPEGDAKLPGSLPKSEQQQAVQALVGTLTELAKEGLTGESLRQIGDRASELKANPDQSLLQGLLGGELGDKLLNAVRDVGFDNSQVINAVGQSMGPEAAQFMQQSTLQVQAFFTSTLAQMATPNAEKPYFGMNQVQLDQGLQTVKEVFAFIAPAFQGEAITQGPSTRLLSDSGPDITVKNPNPGEPIKLDPNAPDGGIGKLISTLGIGADGQPIKDPKAALAQVIALGEAAMEFLIGLAGKLAQGDQVEHLKQLGQALETLKQQKLGLMNKIIGKEAELQGSEFQSAVQAEEARKAAESAKNCAIVGAVFAVIAAVIIAVIAVVLAVVTFGAGTGGSVALMVGAVTLATMAVTSATLVCVTIVAVCAVIMAVMTIVANLPNLLRAAAMIMKEAGLDGMAAALEDAAKWFEDNVTSKEWFKIMNIVVQCTAGLVMAVASFGLGSVLAVATAAVTIGSAAASIGVAVGTYMANKAMIEAQYAVALLKGQLAKVEVAIKQIMIELNKVRNQEDNEQKRVQDSEEQLQNIMKNLNACVDSLAKIREEVNYL